jgi:hypothetical protein
MTPKLIDRLISLERDARKMNNAAGTYKVKGEK